eukprot:7041925-Pyramimonas_sp.AAC.1
MSPSASPEPAAEEDEDEDPLDPLGAFSEAPPNSTPWSPYARTVDQKAAMALQRAKDDTGKASASSWDH